MIIKKKNFDRQKEKKKNSRRRKEMFQCIIQQRNGWIHAPNAEYRDVYPGNRKLTLSIENTERLMTFNVIH